ncbi:MAG: hypothetical protein D3910_06315 [Candidatus Electrothrix sp. ATG2]|nr:hypothetical protein [Candidatus Electrothrix sp. ATG2]
MKWFFYHNRQLRELTNKVVLKITSSHLEAPDASERKLIEQLRHDFEKIDRQVTHQPHQPSEKVWTDNMQRLTELVRHEDPRLFLHWGVIQKAMFITNAMYILIELFFLKKQKKWSKRWRDAIQEDKIGTPIPYWCFPSSSGNLIHHAYHVSQLETQMHIDVSEFDFIVECGGGYGSMCRLFRNLGFKGTYIIFDLPHFSALQKYYLESVGVKVVDEINNDTEMQVKLVSDMDELHDSVERVESRKSLFLATWSLSETPLKLRKDIRLLYRKFDLLFFAYQESFGEVNNIEYFGKLQREEKQFHWQTWEVESLPTHYYSAGKFQE